MKRTCLVIVCLLLFAHAAIDVAFAGLHFLRQGYLWGDAISYAVTGQISLLAIWAAQTRFRLDLRCPILVLGSSALGFIMLWHGRVWIVGTFPRAVTVTVQVVAILLVIGLGRTACYLVCRRSGGGSPRFDVQFSIVSILVWTTELAVILGVGKLVVQELAWTAEWHGSSEYIFAAIDGLFNAFTAILMFAAVTRKRLFLSTLAAIALLVPLAWVETHVVDDFVLPSGYLKWASPSIGDRVFPLFYVYATLLPLRLCGWLGPGSQQPFAPSLSASLK